LNWCEDGLVRFIIFNLIFTQNLASSWIKVSNRIIWYNEYYCTKTKVTLATVATEVEINQNDSIHGPGYGCSIIHVAMSIKSIRLGQVVSCCLLNH
jgi:hypothetical protein